MKSNKILILILALNTIISTYAQTGFSASVTYQNDSNPFHLPVASSSSITSFDFGIDQSLNILNISYLGSYNIYHSYEDANFYWQQIALYSDSDSISWGAVFDNRINNEKTSYLNYYSGSAYFKYLFEAADIYWKINADANIMKYKDMTDLDNYTLSLYLGGIKSFETGTTMILGTETNYKSYLNSFNQSDKNYSSDIVQLNLISRISQKLLDNLGAAVFYTNKIIINNPSLNPLKYEMGYGDESIYYEDAKASKGYVAGTLITGIFPSDITVRGGFNYSKADYTSQPIYMNSELMDFNVSRSDTKYSFSISASKEIPLTNDYSSILNLSIDFQHINNESNSYWFNYKTNTYTLGAEIVF